MFEAEIAVPLHPCPGDDQIEPLNKSHAMNTKAAAALATNRTGQESSSVEQPYKPPVPDIRRRKGPLFTLGAVAIGTCYF